MNRDEGESLDIVQGRVGIEGEMKRELVDELLEIVVQSQHIRIMVWNVHALEEASVRVQVLFNLIPLTDNKKLTEPFFRSSKPVYGEE